jgi:glycosyltransferase involved in cell wall biosynthesis
MFSCREIDVAAHLLFIGGEDHDLRLPFMIRFRERGYRVTAAGTGSSTPFDRAGIAFRRFKFARFVNPLADWQALPVLRQLVAEVGPDLVQCFDTKLNLLVPIALGRVSGAPPVVRTINGRGWLYSSHTPAALALRLVYRGLHRMAARSTRADVFEHADDQAFFERHHMVGPGGSLVIPGAGIDVDGFERDVARGPSPAELRRVLGLGQEPIVMTVTRMTRQKGIGSLLQAAAIVNESHPTVRFLLVGPRESEGPLAISKEEIDRHAPYVIATGPRPDVPSLLGIADVFAFPTEYREGIPRALCEAALAKVPIVTTGMPGCRQVVRDGWNGFVVPPHAPELLAARIRDLLDNPQKALLMAARGAEPVRQLFSLEAIVARYATLYDAAIRSGPDGRLADLLRAQVA